MLDDITERLKLWNHQKANAWDHLLPQVYDELNRMAKNQLTKQEVDMLDPTALVHELYCQFLKLESVGWENRKHFFGVAALAMRQIIVDEAIKMSTSKRGGQHVRVTTSALNVLTGGDLDVDIVDLESAMHVLEKSSATNCRIVELRFFAGCSMKEIAEYLGISLSSAEKRLVLARPFLYRQLYSESRGVDALVGSIKE